MQRLKKFFKKFFKKFSISVLIVLALLVIAQHPQEALSSPDIKIDNNLQFVNETPQFPDRTDAHQHAVNLEIAREASRLQAIEAEKQAQAVQSTTVAQNTPTVAQNGSCMDWIRQAGVTDVQSAYTLIMRESGCNPNSVNRSSGACGIPQALPCSKLGTSDPVAQIRWMQNYCVSRYGSWAGALAHSNSVGWY